MKLFSKSTNGKMLKLGETPQSANFYFMTDAVKAVIDNFKMGEDVTIQTKSENGYEWITDIQKLSASQAGLSTPTINKGGTNNPPSTPPPSAPKAQGITTGAKPDVGVTPQKNGYIPREEWIAQQKAKGLWREPSADKGTDTNASIKRQAIAHATSRTMIGLAHLITESNIEEIMTRVYKKYVELVG